MQTRIRFKYDDGSKGKTRHNSTIATSRQMFNVDGKEVQIFMHLKEFYFEFIDKDGNIVHKGGNASNTAVLLRQVKRELVKRGCEFGNETRSKETNDNGESGPTKDQGHSSLSTQE